MKNYDYLIVGAGLTGAVFAYEMHKAGKKVLVIEKRDHIAGNIYTKDEDGILVHKYGAHIFHTSNIETYRYVEKFCQMDPFINSPIANYKGEIYNLPFNMNTFSKMWGISTPDEAKKIIQQQIKDSGIKEPKNLEEQAISMVGIDIYKKLVKDYTKKQWGRECKDLPSFIIKRLPVRYIFDNNYFSDPYQGIPREGYTKIVEKMLEKIEVKTNTDYFSDRDYFDNIAEKILFTGRIDSFFEGQLESLEYRSLKFEEKRYEIANYQGNAVINYTSDKEPYTRSIEHKHFNKNTAEKTDFTIISYEYPVEFNETEEPYYPVNDEKNTDLYNKYLEHSKNRKDVIFAGRLGSYKYLDMHVTIERALELVKKELGDK